MKLSRSFSGGLAALVAAVALPVLEECLLAASRLGGLRRVAGQAGEPQTLVGIKIGLKARFTRVEPKAS